MKKTREIIIQEALEVIIPLHRGSIALSMGVGKTYLALLHAANFYTDTLRILVVVPKLSIKDSWLDEIRKWGLAYLLPNIEFTTYISLTKKDLAYDIVYLDECHSLTLAHKQWLDLFKGKIIGLTGTPPKYEHSEKGKMVHDFCPTVYRYSTDDAVGDDILNDYRIVVHEMQLSEKKDLWLDQKNGKGWYTSEKLNYEYWTGRVHRASSKKEQQIMRVMRMKALMGYKTKESYTRRLLAGIEDKVIVFCNTQIQAENLCQEVYHSKKADAQTLEDFKSGKIMKLGTVQMLSEGVNIPDLRQIIIMHSFSGSSPKSPQKLGRALRLNPDQIAIAHILMYKDCMDESWVNSVLEGFDSTKVSYKKLTGVMS